MVNLNEIKLVDQFVQKYLGGPLGAASVTDLENAASYLSDTSLQIVLGIALVLRNRTVFDALCSLLDIGVSFDGA